MSICAATAAMADVPHVVTDIPPIHALTSQVMHGVGAPVLLLDRGADEHNFQLRPSQMADISRADMAIWIGPELTPWLARAWQSAKADAVSLPLLSMKGTITRDYAAKDEGHEGHGHDDHGHGGDEHDDHGNDDHGHDDSGHDDHAHSGVDAHAWLDPRNASFWLDEIADTLAQRDPANAALYRANAQKAKADIAALDAELATLLAPVKDKGFVTYHDAYGYFTAHYGLTFAGSIALGDASGAGAAHISALGQKIATDVVCVFPEAQHDARLLLQLLDGTKAKAGAALDPVGAVQEPGAEAYAALMRALAGNLHGCLSGA
jgi:zinc transport system substrate-binding protein